ERLDYDGPGMASVLAGSSEGPFRERLREADVVLAFTRSADLVGALRPIARRLVVRDPAPILGHASLWLAEAARELGADPHVRPPDMEPTSDEQAAAEAVHERLPASFLALHPGSGSPAKNWPADRFAALARARSPDRPWLLVRGPADEPAARALGEAGPRVE